MPLQPSVSRTPPSKQPWGLIVFGAGLILTSVQQMAVLLDADRYWYLFQDLPPAAIMGRYVMSWLARALGLAAGIGLLQRRERCRQLTVALACATIATVTWKHPYDGFARHLSDLERRFPEATAQLRNTLGQLGVSWSTLTWIAVWVARAQELFLALLLLWYVTRPRVKACFRPPPRARDRG